MPIIRAGVYFNLSSIVLSFKIPGNEELNNLTERPVTRKHVGEVGDDVEGGVDDIRHGQVDKEVVGHGAHSLVRHHDPDY